jgi:hypothetical protein
MYHSAKDVDRGGCSCVGAGVHGSSLYFLLNFAALNNKVYFKVSPCCNWRPTGMQF